MRIKGLNQITINSFILDMLFPAFGLNLSLSFKHLHNCLTKVLVALLREVQHFAGLETCIFQSPMMTIIVIVVPAIKSFPFQGFFRLIYLSTYLNFQILNLLFSFIPTPTDCLKSSCLTSFSLPTTCSFPASYSHKQQRWL